MKKKIIFKIAIIFVILMIILTNNIYADNSDKSIWELGKEWLNLGNEEAQIGLDDEIDNSRVYDGFEEMAGILLGAGIVVVICVGVILGIRYMISEPEQKAQLKKSLYAYLVGTIIICGAAGIWKLVVDFLEDMARS